MTRRQTLEELCTDLEEGERSEVDPKELSRLWSRCDDLEVLVRVYAHQQSLPWIIGGRPRGKSHARRLVGALLALLDWLPAVSNATNDAAALALVRRWIERGWSIDDAREAAALIPASERVERLVWACRLFYNAGEAWNAEEVAAAERQAARCLIDLGADLVEIDEDGRMAKQLRKTIRPDASRLARRE